MERFARILVYAGTRENAVADSRSAELAIEDDGELALIDGGKSVPKAIVLITDAILVADTILSSPRIECSSHRGRSIV